MHLFLNAERQANYQDPQITLANQLRAHLNVSPLPTAPAIPPRPVQPPNLPNPITVPPVSVPTVVPLQSPSTLPSADLEQHPEMLVFRQCFRDEKPLSERPTLTLNKTTYYALPGDLPKPSRALYKALEKASRCTNCGNADGLFPHHTWRHCPFYTPPHRSSLWPAHQSPIKSIAAGGVPSKTPPDPPESDLRTFTGWPVQLNPVAVKEPPRYTGIVTSLNIGTSDYERGTMHVFPVQFRSPTSTST